MNKLSSTFIKTDGSDKPLGDINSIATANLREKSAIPDAITQKEWDISDILQPIVFLWQKYFCYIIRHINNYTYMYKLTWG